MNQDYSNDNFEQIEGSGEGFDDRNGSKYPRIVRCDEFERPVTTWPLWFVAFMLIGFGIAALIARASL